MSSETWPAIVGLAGAVLSLVGGVATVPLINHIKTTFNWSGRTAQALTIVASIVVAGLTVIATGAVNPEPISVAYIIELLTLVLVASQAEYQRIKNSSR